MNGHDKIILGIHNYCDRWCERCTLTSRCSVFEAEMQDPLPKGDLSSKEFWNKLSGIFDQVLALIAEKAQQEGIDLSEESLQEIKEREKENRKRTKDHYCVQMAFSYTGMARAWIENAEEMLKNKEKEWEMRIRTGVNESGIESEYATLNEALEVINWYVFFIYTKIHRALHREEDDFLDELMRDDCNGSAKIALIAIDRSIAAWGHMVKAFEEKTDEILDILVLLGKLRKAVMFEFPQALEFVRPGFDEVQKAC